MLVLQVKLNPSSLTTIWKWVRFVSVQICWDRLLCEKKLSHLVSIQMQAANLPLGDLHLDIFSSTR